MNQLEILRESLGQCDEIILDALIMRNRIVEDIMAYKEARLFLVPRSIPISLVGMEIPFLFLRSPHPLQLIITFYSLYRGLIRFSYNNSIK